MRTSKLTFGLVLVALVGCGGDDGGGGGGGDAAGGGDGAAGVDGAVGGPDGSGCPTTLPTTTMIVDGVTYYRVHDSVTPNPGAYVRQVNFGTQEQFLDCEGEPGANSTFTIAMTFETKPATTGSLTYTSSRSATPGAVNFYLNFLNTGHARANTQFKTPDSGTFEFAIEGTAFDASVTDLTMTNEVDGADSFSLSGRFLLDPW